jgi:hypothetical protein
MLTVAHGRRWDRRGGSRGGHAVVDRRDRGVTGTASRPGTSTDARSGCATRLRYQSGCRRQAPWPSANHATGDCRGCPLRRPTVCRTRTSMPRKLPRPRPMLRFIRAFMGCWTHGGSAPGEPLLPLRNCLLVPCHWLPRASPSGSVCSRPSRRWAGCFVLGRSTSVNRCSVGRERGAPAPSRSPHQPLHGPQRGLMPLTARVTGGGGRGTPVASAVAAHPEPGPRPLAARASSPPVGPSSAAPPVPSAGVGNSTVRDTRGLPAARSWSIRRVGGGKRRPQVVASAGRRLGNSRRSRWSAPGPGSLGGQRPAPGRRPATPVLLGGRDHPQRLSAP